MYSNLDLRRLIKIIVTPNLNEEIATLTKSKESSTNNSVYLTKNDSFAKVVILPHDNNFDMVLVMRSDFIECLNHKSKKTCLMTYEDAAHVFHHELVHVHDNNKRIDLFPEDIKEHHYEGVKQITYPLVQLCWGEYIANYISSESAARSLFPTVLAQSLVKNIKEVRFNMQNEILAYRTNQDRDKLFASFKLQIQMLLKNAAYLLGYMHGMNKTLEEICDQSAYDLELSYFNTTWEAMSKELLNMRHLYPDAWSSLAIYNPLANLFEQFSLYLGVKLFENENRELCFDVPAQ